MVAIGYDPVKRQLLQLVSNENYYFHAEDFDALAGEVKALTRKSCLGEC